MHHLICKLCQKSKFGLYVKMGVPPNGPPAHPPYPHPVVDPATGWLKDCAGKSGETRCVSLDPSERLLASLSVFLCPVGGAAAILKEGLESQQGLWGPWAAEDSGDGRNWRLEDSPRNKCQGQMPGDLTRARKEQVPTQEGSP